jgi:uncharacterized protein YuzE
MRDQKITIEVDSVANAAYVRLSRDAAVKTITHGDAINIDLDEFGIVVGIEVLDLAAEIPFGALTSQYHVDSAQMKLLRSTCPTITGFAAQFHTDGSLAASAARRMASPA